MIRKLIAPIFSLVLLSTQLTATESVVRVSQTLSQQKAYAGGTFMVKIRIERRNLDSFFEIEQDLPPGMTAQGVESQGSTFLYKEGKVTYTWLRLPKDEEIQVMYKVNVPFEARGLQSIAGTYYYVLDEEKEVYTLPNTNIEIVEYLAPSDSVAERSFLGIVNNDSNKPSYTAEAKNDLMFKVQILSSTNKLDSDSIRSVYGVKDKIQEENINGVFKYTAGSFATYEQARDYKNKLDFQRYIPFIIAYNRGGRITIGEAMQIASHRKTISKN
jgi:hypothetical protein